MKTFVIDDTHGFKAITLTVEAKATSWFRHS